VRSEQVNERRDQQALRRVPELGGELLVRPTDIPGLARFAITADPTGAILAVSTHGNF
jgi:predicted enzyme related to lactoylglutathione lyase